MLTIFPFVLGFIACGEKETDTAQVIHQSFILEEELIGASGCEDFIFPVFADHHTKRPPIHTTAVTFRLYHFGS